MMKSGHEASMLRFPCVYQGRWVRTKVKDWFDNNVCAILATRECPSGPHPWTEIEQNKMVKRNEYCLRFIKSNISEVKQFSTKSNKFFYLLTKQVDYIDWYHLFAFIFCRKQSSVRSCFASLSVLSSNLLQRWLSLGFIDRGSMNNVKTHRLRLVSFLLKVVQV